MAQNVQHFLQTLAKGQVLFLFDQRVKIWRIIILGEPITVKGFGSGFCCDCIFISGYKKLLKTHKEAVLFTLEKHPDQLTIYSYTTHEGRATGYSSFNATEWQTVSMEQFLSMTWLWIVGHTEQICPDRPAADANITVIPKIININTLPSR